MLKEKHKPFLKWIGGKTRLLKQLDNHLPNYIKQQEPFIYVEPFLVWRSNVLSFIKQL